MIFVGPPEYWPDWLKNALRNLKEKIEEIFKRAEEKDPAAIKTIEAINAGINPIAAAVGFTLFFLEEGAQAVMFAIIGAQQVKRYDLVGKLVPQGKKLVELGRKTIEQIGWINPLMSDAYTAFFDAMDAFFSAAEQIAVTGKPVWGEQTLWDLRKVEGEE